MTPVRVHRRRTKGYRLPPNTVSVTRPGKFGNPFRVGRNGMLTSYTAVECFAAWLANDADGRSVAALARERLRGKNLACYCPLETPCHADVLLRVANEERQYQ